MKTQKQIEGYQLMSGAMLYIGSLFVKGMIIIVVIILVLNSLSIGTDDSDKSGWSRSGLMVHTDAKTGIQYLSDGHGGLVRRELKLGISITPFTMDGVGVPWFVWTNSAALIPSKN